MREGILSQDRTEAVSLSSIQQPALWSGDGLIGRSIRFTLVLMVPIIVGLMLGASMWVAYAIMTCILSYMLDTGGAVLSRLTGSAFSVFVIIWGAALGTMVRGDPALMALVFGGSAFLYGIVEGFHSTAGAAARFLCLAASIAALYAPMEMLDVVVVIGCALFSWMLSVGWDMAIGIWRPWTGPKIGQLPAYLGTDKAARLVFAAITGLTVAGSFLFIRKLGLEHLNWAILALMIVLHADTEASRRMAKNLFLGTLLGVAAAWIYGVLFNSTEGLIIGMTLAAMIHWPIQQRSGSLGQATMAIFIVLLLQLLSHLTGQRSHAPADRLIDISLGCMISFIALSVNAAVQRLLQKVSP